MHKYFKKFDSRSSTSALDQAKDDRVEVRSSNPSEDVLKPVRINPQEEIAQDTHPSLINEVDISSLPADPADRQPIMIYHPNIRDEVRRHYIKTGPYQPRLQKYPRSNFSGKQRAFVVSWFDEYRNWMEYSIKKDAVFCLPCYIFSSEFPHQGGDTFSSKGFTDWNKKDRFGVHVGKPSSVHSQCYRMCIDLMNQKNSIDNYLEKQKKQNQIDYRTRLNASIDVIRLLLISGLPFRGHDESESSTRKGNFLTFLNWYAERVEAVGDVVLRRVQGNVHMTAPVIQKDIVKACASETVKAIIKDIGDDYYAILADESRDVSHKEQMALVLRYVDKKGFVMERLVGLVHVSQTSAVALKEAIYSLLAKHSLSPDKIRGQCYDGASNMQGHLNGLKTLIMSDSISAHSVHCFAHQLQLTLVAVARTHEDVEWLFDRIDVVLNVIGLSFKNRDMLREKQALHKKEAHRSGVLRTGRGMNQELGLNRPGDTRWGSHYKSLVNMITLFPSIIEVISDIAMNGLQSSDRLRAQGLLGSLHSFRFAYMLHLMNRVLAITDDLNTAMQKREQDIVNAMALLDTAKRQLQTMRDDGWEELLSEVTSFCHQHDIDVLDMDATHIHWSWGIRSVRRVDDVKNNHYYRVSVLYTIVDMQIQELNSRFTEVNTELLIGMSCLNPADSFSSFDKTKLLRMARLYPDDFDGESKIQELSYQLDNFIANMCDDTRFSNLKGISDLVRRLVETKQHLNFSKVFLLLKLALILPVATATVERAFSAMKYLKTDLRNRMEDEGLNNCLITYVKQDVFATISNEKIMHNFQAMKSRRVKL